MNQFIQTARALLICGLVPMCFHSAANAGVVINEIFYHAPDDFDDLEWVEVYNPDDQPVDLADWKLTGGVEFHFKKKATIPPRGFLVICKDAKLFGEFYDVPVVGEYKKSIGNGGDTLELVDAAGATVDRVVFKDGDPWPTAADGSSASLERITPEMPGERADNWSASPLPEDEARPAGTPGRANASFSANFPPVIGGLVLSSSQPLPGKPVRVSATVEDADGLASVELRYRIVRPGTVGDEQVVPMKSTDGKNFSAELPGQVAGSLVRLRVHATDRAKSGRFYPSPNDLRPAVSVFVQARPEAATMPVVQMIHAGGREFAEMERVRLQSLNPHSGPMQPSELDMLLEEFSGALDLQEGWFEWSVNQELDLPSYRALRNLIAAKQSERNAFMEEAAASTDVTVLKAEAPAHIKAFQDSLVAGVKTALPTEKGAAFEVWYRERLKPVELDQTGFLKRFLNIESPWLALNARFELTESQLNHLRPSLRAADKGRSEMLSAFRGDFAALLRSLGRVETELNAAAEEQLTLRERRYLQEWKSGQGSPIRPRVIQARGRSPRGNAAFIYTDQETGATEVFDFVHITERSAGYKVRFQKDRRLHGMSTANVIFEYNDRFVMAEPLAFELYRRLGNAACATDFVRLTLNGHPLGYHLLFEQVNGSFFDRNRITSGGELYKILWYGLGIEGQHEKQDHPDRDYSDLVKLIASLDSTSGADQWEVIQSNFNVDQVATYFAVNMVLSHWDGFFNNYFTYHDRKGGGKREMYPWDQDKT